MERSTLLTIFGLFCASSAPAAFVSRLSYDGRNYDLYAGGNDNMTLAAASAQATLLGGSLVRIETSAENAAIFAWLTVHTSSITSIATDGGGARYVWLGGSDSASEGSWRWMDNNDLFYLGTGVAGSPQGGLYNNFGVGIFTQEPDDFSSAQDGLAIAMDDWPAPVGVGGNAAGKWNDISVANTMAFVVEIPEPSSLGLLALGTILLRRRRCS